MTKEVSDGSTVEQMAIYGCLYLRLMAAVADRNERQLIELLPDDKDCRGDKAIMLYGTMSDLMKVPGKEFDFRWIMGTICRHKRHKEFVAVFWASVLQNDINSQKEIYHA